VACQFPLISSCYYIWRFAEQPDQGLDIDSPTPVPDMLEALGLTSKMVEQYGDFLAALGGEEDVPARVLALCSLRVAAIRDTVDQWSVRNTAHGLSGRDLDAVVSGDFADFDPAERAALTLTERIPLAWHELTDEETAEVAEHFGPKGCVTLMTAIAYFDVNGRLETTLSSIAADPA
jgi:alkylhydroperoxidase family enzyme